METSQAATWEYHVKKLDLDYGLFTEPMVSSQLISQGKDGWELTIVLETAEGALAIFKRQKSI
jgi:hypothetical protein